MSTEFRLTPPNPPNDGIMFADLEKLGRSGHLGHALVEYAPGKVLAFYPSCSAEDPRWKGHSGFGWMEYKRSLDGGETWSGPIVEPHSRALFDKGIGRTHMCEKAIVTDSGRIYLYYLTCDMKVNGHIWEPYYEPYYAFSDDGGETWSEKKIVTYRPGRIYDVIYKDGVIYVLFFANPELPGIAHVTEHELQLLVSTDGGETYDLRSVMPFQSMKYSFYGTMEFMPDGRLIVYTYDENDEFNLKYCVSSDNGCTWPVNNRRAFFEKCIRNPQLKYYKGKYFLHGRSGGRGPNPAHFILYTSDDGMNWDSGSYLRMRSAGTGAYSNNLIVHAPDGRERLMIQTSHAYFENRTNVIMFWIDAD